MVEAAAPFSPSIRNSTQAPFSHGPFFPCHPKQYDISGVGDRNDDVILVVVAGTAVAWWLQGDGGKSGGSDDGGSDGSGSGGNGSSSRGVGDGGDGSGCDNSCGNSGGDGEGGGGCIGDVGVKNGDHH